MNMTGSSDGGAYRRQLERLADETHRRNVETARKFAMLGEMCAQQSVKGIVGRYFVPDQAREAIADLQELRRAVDRLIEKYKEQLGGRP